MAKVLVSFLVSADKRSDGVEEFFEEVGIAFGEEGADGDGAELAEDFSTIEAADDDDGETFAADVVADDAKKRNFEPQMGHGWTRMGEERISVWGQLRGGGAGG